MAVAGGACEASLGAARSMAVRSNDGAKVCDMYVALYGRRAWHGCEVEG